EIREIVRSRGLNMFSITIPAWTVIPDILWGQAYRLLSRISIFLEENEFRVLMNKVWSDEEKNVVLLFILEEVEKRAAVLHMGPPYFSNNVPIFIETYLNNERTLVQPFPRNGRWWTILKPKARDVSEAFSKALSSKEFLKGFSDNILKALSESKMCYGEDVVEAVDNAGYLSFLEKNIHPFSWMLRED
ncbi:MAG: hypothetical protein QXT26_02185, partial [Thermoproteota archaeon]